MQIFSNEQPDPLPLETDERLRLQAIHQTLKRHWMGPMVLVAVLLIPFAFVLLGLAGVRAGTIHLARDALLRCAVPGI